MADKKMIIIAVVIVILIVVLGYFIMSNIIYKKWGYTPEREKKLEELKEENIYKFKRK